MKITKDMVDAALDAYQPLVRKSKEACVVAMHNALFDALAAMPFDDTPERKWEVIARDLARILVNAENDLTQAQEKLATFLSLASTHD